MASLGDARHFNYFEAILQLRDCSREIINFVKREIASAERVKLAKLEKVTGGWDFYLSSRKFAVALGKKLIKKYSGDFKVTSSLFGEKDGRKIYRLTVLFRSFSLKKGGIIKYKGENYSVKCLFAKEIMLQKVSSGEKVHLKYKDFGQITRQNS